MAEVRNGASVLTTDCLDGIAAIDVSTMTISGIAAIDDSTTTISGIAAIDVSTTTIPDGYRFVIGVSADFSGTTIIAGEGDSNRCSLVR